MCSSKWNEDSWLANERVAEPLYIRKEIELLATNPVAPLILRLRDIQADESSDFVIDETDRCAQAFHFYHLSLERYLEDLRYEIRWQKDLRWIRGRGRSYTDHQKKMAKKYHAHKHFTELDFVNCLLHARILCDRVIALSRHFLYGQEQLPSFTSFNKHRKFFMDSENPIPEHQEYSQYFREHTGWFEVLKPIRDKFIVHHGPKHMKVLGWQSEHDLTLALYISDDSQDSALGKRKMISISVRRLARDLKEFLGWFCSYGLEALG